MRPLRIATMRVFRAQLPLLLARFTETNAGLRAAIQQSMVHVRDIHAPEDVRELLERTLYINDGSRVSAAQAVFEAIAGAIRLERQRGIIGTGTFPGFECRLDRHVQLPEGPATVTALLDSVVQQAPGLVWLITYDDQLPMRGMKIGLMCPGGGSLMMPLYP